MKKFFVLLLSGSLFFISCENKTANDDAEVAPPQEATAAAGTDMIYMVDTNASVIKWEGGKSFTDSKHNGTIRLQGGEFYVTGDTVKGGKFTVRMASLQDHDLEESKDMEGKQKLETHLKSEDFFDVAKYPTAVFEVTQIKDSTNNYKVVSGNITIKAKTANITFPAKVNMNGDELRAEGDFVIDRSKFDVRYGSSTYLPDLAKDKVISNDIKLSIDLKAKKQAM